MDFSIDPGIERLAFVSGFPDLQAQGSQEFKGHPKSKGSEFSTMLRDNTGRIEKIVGNYVFYSNITTVIGQSGGPVFTEINKKLYMIGMHNEYSLLNKMGKGLYFSETIWRTLTEWAERLNVPIKPQNYVNYHMFKEGTLKDPQKEEHFLIK